MFIEIVYDSQVLLIPFEPSLENSDSEILTIALDKPLSNNADC